MTHCNRLPHGKSIVSEGGRVIGFELELGDVQDNDERCEYYLKCVFRFKVDEHVQVDGPVRLLPWWPDFQGTMVLLRSPIDVPPGAVLEAQFVAVAPLKHGASLDKLTLRCIYEEAPTMTTARDPPLSPTEDCASCTPVAHPRSHHINGTGLCLEVGCPCRAFTPFPTPDSSKHGTCYICGSRSHGAGKRCPYFRAHKEKP